MPTPTPAAAPTPTPLGQLRASHTQRVAALGLLRASETTRLDGAISAAEAVRAAYFTSTPTIVAAKAALDSARAPVDAQKRIITDTLEALKASIVNPADHAQIDQIKRMVNAATNLTQIQNFINAFTPPAVTGTAPAQPSPFRGMVQPATNLNDADFALGETILRDAATRLKSELETYQRVAVQAFHAAAPQARANKQNVDQVRRQKTERLRQLDSEQHSLDELLRDITAIERVVTTGIGHVTAHNTAAGTTVAEAHARLMIEHCFVAAYETTKKPIGHAHGEKVTALNHFYFKDGMEFDIETEIPPTAAGGAAPSVVISPPPGTAGAAAPAAGTGIPVPPPRAGTAPVAHRYRTNLKLIDAFSENNKGMKAQLTGDKQDDAVMLSFRALAGKFNNGIYIDNKGNKTEKLRFMAIADHLKETDPKMAKLKTKFAGIPNQYIYRMMYKREYNAMREALRNGRSTLSAQHTTLTPI